LLFQTPDGGTTAFRFRGFGSGGLVLDFMQGNTWTGLGDLLLGMGLASLDAGSWGMASWY